MSMNGSLERLIKAALKKTYRILFPVRESEIDKKNARVNENIRQFLAGRAEAELPPREEDMRVEVLIPCYNHGRYLEDALRSVYSNGSGFAVTVINDASTDDTARHIERLRGSHDFKYIENPENLNQAGSLNKAVAESENNFFVILNADDCLFPYSIRTVADLAERHREARLFGGGCLRFRGESMLRYALCLPTRLSYDPSMRRFDPEQVAGFTKAQDLDMSMSGSAFFKSAWLEVGGFYPFERRVCSYDDRDFQLRVASVFPVGVVEEPLAMWRQTSSTGRGEL